MIEYLLRMAEQPRHLVGSPVASWASVARRHSILSLKTLVSTLCLYLLETGGAPGRVMGAG